MIKLLISKLKYGHSGKRFGQMSWTISSVKLNLMSEYGILHLELKEKK
ncbi:MAG: hypothetical protein ACR5KV_06295 [Wolbachia sp.]